MEERERIARALCKRHDIDPDKLGVIIKTEHGPDWPKGKTFPLWEYWAAFYVDVVIDLMKREG